jgi:hypothetical protein
VIQMNNIIPSATNRIEQRAKKEENWNYKNLIN